MLNRVILLCKYIYKASYGWLKRWKCHWCYFFGLFRKGSRHSKIIYDEKTWVDSSQVVNTTTIWCHAIQIQMELSNKKIRYTRQRYYASSEKSINVSVTRDVYIALQQSAKLFFVRRYYSQTLKITCDKSENSFNTELDGEESNIVELQNNWIAMKNAYFSSSDIENCSVTLVDSMM